MARARIYRRPPPGPKELKRAKAWNLVSKYVTMRKRFLKKERVQSSEIEINQVINDLIFKCYILQYCDTINITLGYK
jgi:hypothetical protein